MSKFAPSKRDRLTDRVYAIKVRDHLKDDGDMSRRNPELHEKRLQRVRALIREYDELTRRFEARPGNNVSDEEYAILADFLKNVKKASVSRLREFDDKKRKKRTK